MATNSNLILKTMAAAAMAIAMMAGAQAPAPPAPAPEPAPAATPAATTAPAAAAPAAPTWSVGPMDISGFIDGYYSFNANRPSSPNAQLNQLYNFNDNTDQFSLSAAKLTLNHDPDPVGAHIDLIYGRTNTLINNAAPAGAPGADQGSYIEQAFLSLKPPKAKGFELDFGKFVTSAGAEVIEAKDNWNYSRSLLFVNAIPYWHFGVRTSMPVSKTETVGFQLVSGWNDVTKTNGGVTGVFTSAYTKPKATWSLNYIVGPENANSTYGLRNLIDTTLLLTPPGKVNAYINFDYGSNRDALEAQGDNKLHTWDGVAFAVHDQAAAKQAVSGRFEYFNDPDGFATGSSSIHGIMGGQHLYEFTGTYEYKWVEGLLTRVEYRGDFSNVDFFAKKTIAGGFAGSVDQQQTITVAFIAFFGPKR